MKHRINKLYHTITGKQ